MSPYFYSPPDPEFDESDIEFEAREARLDERWRRMSPEDREAVMLRLDQNYGRWGK